MDEVLNFYGTVATAKAAKGTLDNSDAERDAAILVETMKAEIEARY
jgi:hypothetical protein